MAPLEINVTGTGSTLHAAERAILVLQAQTQDLPSAAEASTTVTTTANTIREMIMPHCPQDEATGRIAENAAIAHYSMSTLDTSSKQRKISASDSTTPAKYETVYSARAEFHIKFSDFAVLNKLATQFSAMENVRIQRIDWNLTDRTYDSIKSGARKLAAEDAMQRAYDYAAVFAGVAKEEVGKKVRAVHVKESNSYYQSTRPQLHYGKMMRGAKVASHELQFQPEDVRLQVNVDGRFEVGT